MQRRRLAVWSVVALAAAWEHPGRAVEESAASLTEQATAALRRNDLPKALEFADRLVKAEPTRPRSFVLRARVQQARGAHEEAAKDLGAAIRIAPATPDYWQMRGEAHFRAAKITESLADFDQFLKLVPEQRPQHWQRGICLYYAGRFLDGKKQFELHQTVNNQDVENAVWHFLCNARLSGLDTARKELIPIQNDGRVPMAQVHRLFAGKGTVAEVLSAAEAAAPESRFGEPLFYAHLYLALYHEAAGKPEQTREHITLAARRARENGYMGDVARVHALLLSRRGSRSKK
jgi:lipoprotein NlpI